MNTRPRLSPIPAGEEAALFKGAIVSIIKVGPDHSPDFEPHPLDESLVVLNGQMHGRRQLRLDLLRSSLDRRHPRRLLSGVRLHKGALLSDLVLAAVMVWPSSPYGLLYEWPRGVDAMWPEGRKFVWWRRALYDLFEDGRMVRWADPEGDE